MIGVELDENDEQVKLAENVANGILGKFFFKAMFCLLVVLFQLGAYARDGGRSENMEGVRPPPPLQPSLYTMLKGKAQLPKKQPIYIF